MSAFRISLPHPLNLALLLGLLLSSIPQSITAEVVRFGYFTMRPHIYYHPESGSAEGVLPSFLKQELGPAMSVEFEFVRMPLARVLFEMKSGSIAGAAMFGYTPERAQALLYPENHFFQMQSAIAVTRQHPIEKIRTIDDLKPLRLSYIVDAILTPFVRHPDLQWDWISGGLDAWQRNLKRLSSGRAVAVYSPQQLNMMASARVLGIGGEIKILPLPEPPQRLYSLFSPHPRYRGLLERYDKAMVDIDGRSVYRQRIGRYLSRMTAAERDSARKLHPW